jgi:hypothetical protein
VVVGQVGQRRRVQPFVAGRAEQVKAGIEDLGGKQGSLFFYF